MINCTFTFSCPCCSLNQTLVMHDQRGKMESSF